MSSRLWLDACGLWLPARSCCRGAIVVRDGIFRTLTTNDWPSVYRTNDQLCQIISYNG